jgi:hypothetical protein
VKNSPESLVDFYERTKCDKHESLRRLTSRRWWNPHREKVLYVLRKADCMNLDKRDPAQLGNLLLVMAFLHGSVRAAYDRSTFRTPDYADETTLQKYGDPRSILSTLPN